MVAGLNPGILAGRRAREFQTRKIKEGKRRLTLGDPESVNRSFEDCLNRPLRIVIENCFVSIVLNDHVPSLTQELHIGGYGRTLRAVEPTNNGALPASVTTTTAARRLWVKFCPISSIHRTAEV